MVAASLREYRSSDDVMICCPFHQDSHPSCSVNLKKHCWYCFVCGKGGSLVKLIAEMEGINEVQALLKMYQLEANCEQYFEENTVSPKQLQDIRMQRMEEAYAFYRSLPKKDWNAEYHPYLMQERGFSASILNSYRVRMNTFGMYPLVFPLYSQGMFCGYTTRALGDVKPKYKHNPGFPRTKLLVSRKPLEKGPVLIVEGWLDNIMPAQHGFTNTASLLHWQVSKTQVKLLSQVATEIISGLDNDEAGERGHEELCRAFHSTLPVSRFKYEEGYKDPGSMIDGSVFWKGLREREPEERLFACA